MAHRHCISSLCAVPGPGARAPKTPALAGLSLRGLRERDDADRAPAPPRAELDLARHQGEQGVVAAAADADARVEVRAALAHQDLAGVDDLAAETLHAEPLGVGVTPVPAGRRALLVCHLCVTSQAFFLLALALSVPMPVIFTWVYFCR